jgi:NRDE-2, necessary for RNA interference
MGEPGARGWAAWSGSSEQSRILASSSHIALQSFKDEQSVSDPYVQWAFQEAAADRTIRMPTRSSSETDESDLYGTILFDDIRPLLTPLRSTCAKSAIRLAWLSMLGLHIPGFAESLSPSRQTNADDRWCHTYLANSNNLSVLFPSDATHRRITTDAFVGAIIGREREYMNPFGPVKNWGYGIMAHLEGVDGKGSLWTKEAVQGTDEPLITRIFAQLRQGEEDPEWDVLCLAFEAATSVKT